MGFPSKEDFLKFLHGFIYPAECVYKNGQVTWENVEGDSGSYTKYGVDLSSHPSLGVEGIKNLTQEQADSIYWNEFNTTNSNTFQIPFCFAYFNCCVNCGKGRADKILGVTGEDLTAFDNELRAFYRRLATAKPSQEKFLKGWLARVDNLEAFLKPYKGSSDAPSGFFYKIRSFLHLC